MALDIFEFWGKSTRVDDGLKSHPLVYHSLDVAAVGQELLTRDERLSEQLASILGLSGEKTTSLALYLLSIHDIGKFAIGFQSKVEELLPTSFSQGPSVVGYNHCDGGMVLYRLRADSFNLPLEIKKHSLDCLVSAAMGHHGSPPRPLDINGLEGRLKREFHEVGVQAAIEFLHEMQILFQIQDSCSSLDDDVLKNTIKNKPASFAISGLAVLCDWIGSNERWFKYKIAEKSLDIRTYYHEYALVNAKRAVDEAGVLPTKLSEALGYTDLIGKDVETSPMQGWAKSYSIPQGPVMIIIEDETGSGKTEAALMLAHRLMKTGHADRLYMAMPTMATANAMFDRLGKACVRMFAGKPSAVLAHSARELHKAYRNAGFEASDTKVQQDKASSLDESDISASISHVAWIQDDRRRAFLADVGAGTIDQALLAVLPSWHHSLRLLGLMRSVLIIDEVHAYDAYALEEIKTLLEFQAGLGGSAIVLSATLQGSFRKQLAESFCTGLKASHDLKEIATVEAEYPMATACSAKDATTTSIKGRKGLGRRIPVRFLRRTEDALAEIETAADAGKAVLYIRNTVDDAIDAQKNLRNRGIDSTLFHARFALVDRLKKEEDIVRRFGKNSSQQDRKGKVLVATQVVEQSLDLDFDFLVSDLAPVDLLIQRAGRLWRHDRTERTGSPELLVVSPYPAEDAGVDWYSSLFRRAAYVYKDHARLWLTAKVLEKEGCIKSPEKLRELVEFVYKKDITDFVPEGLHDSLFESEGNAFADRANATNNVLSLSFGYRRQGMLWDNDLRTTTRLIEVPQVTLRLANAHSDSVQPYALSRDMEGLEQRLAWRHSEVNISMRLADCECIPERFKSILHKAKEDWNRFDADKILVLLEQADSQGAYVGEAGKGDEKKRVDLAYSTEYGLSLAKSE